MKSTVKSPESASQPHLLTLPREIRDIIYKFLGRTVQYGPGHSLFTKTCFEHEVSNVPPSQLKLTCHRIYEETRELRKSRYNMHFCHTDERAPQEILDSVKPDIQIRVLSLQYLVIRDLYFSRKHNSRSGDVEYWEKLESIVNALPNLQVLKLRFGGWSEQTAKRRLLKYPKKLLKASRRNYSGFEDLPDEISGMPLRQRAFGFAMVNRIGYANWALFRTQFAEGLVYSKLRSCRDYWIEGSLVEIGDYDQYNSRTDAYLSWAEHRIQN